MTSSLKPYTHPSGAGADHFRSQFHFWSQWLKLEEDCKPLRITSVAWNWPWLGHLHPGKQQMIKVRSFFQRERQLGNTDEQTVPSRGSRDAVAGVGALLSPRGQLTGLQWQRGPSSVCTVTAFSELSIGTQTISQA